jgi:hypothetical protein
MQGVVLLSMAFLGMTLTSQPVMAQQETVLHNFGFVPFGGPQAGVIFDAAENIYGTTPQGVYELTPTSTGAWKAHTLYVVPFPAITEGNPVLDSAGNVYGVQTGGQTDDGEVFELTSTMSGSWTKKTLYSFPLSGKRGFSPYAGVVFDTVGNIFGTTLYGGAYCTTFHNGFCGGTAYELSPKAGEAGARE